MTSGQPNTSLGLASLERPGGKPASLRAWLRGVVLNLARKTRRTEIRVERREKLAAHASALVDAGIAITGIITLELTPSASLPPRPRIL